MTSDEVLTILREPNGSERLMAKAEEAFAPSLSLLAQEEAAAAAFLVRVAKQKQYRQEINEWLGDRSLLYRLLQSEDAKMRKNIARLIGRLMEARDARPLMAALEHESKRLARPSMILALGALKTPQAIQFLSRYEVEPAKDITEEKHEKEEREALEKALSGVRKGPVHTFKDFRSPVMLELRCARGLENQLAEELTRVRRVFQGGVIVEAESWTALQKSRLWREALLPLACGVMRRPEAIAEAAASQMAQALQTLYGGEAPYTFRVEIAGRANPEAAVSRAELAKTAAREMVKASGGLLVNAPGNYETELRVEPQSKNPELTNLYLKLFLPSDQRFAYRKGTIPASIHPANAAGVIRLAAPYLKPGAAVMDPCCGSGTLLIERAIFGKAQGAICKRLVGVDIYGKALKIAEGNIKAAHLGAGTAVRLVRSDFLEWNIEEPMDELMANLPFGNRVGSHKENLRLYQGLAEKLPSWVKPGGIAVLYTMEGRLLDRCLAKQERVQILQRSRVEAGGLEPKVFIIRIL